MRRGPYPEEVAFDAPVQVPDGHGGIETGWADEAQAYRARARFRYLRGGEVVQAARLSGRQPIVVTLRYDAAAMVITTGWRMRNEQTGEVANIRTAPVRAENGHEIEMTVETGVAT